MEESGEWRRSSTSRMHWNSGSTQLDQWAQRLCTDQVCWCYRVSSVLLTQMPLTCIYLN